ncbi:MULTISPECIES: hypothetical protein [Sinorhizobium]|uniref:hypothetical protein n=1 Tax=Sinorhizobium TaxID=28105 RepID=UPI000C9A516C|nr:hypothetical protein [Sinorhizobium sp. M4_45]PND24114.1 hypothetical protein CN933_28490 [Sinorhizobium sp. M4_45]
MVGGPRRERLPIATEAPRWRLAAPTAAFFQMLNNTLRRIGILTLVSQLVTFSIFTYFPPQGCFR